MKKVIEVANADELFEAIKNDEGFEVKETKFGLSLRYNGIFRLLANPEIELIKTSDSSIKIKVSANLLLLLVAVVTTVFFWMLGAYAIIVNKLNTPVIIFVFLLPSFMWILNAVFNNQIAKNIVEDLNKYNQE